MKKILVLGVSLLALAGCSKMLEDIRPKHAIPAETVTVDDLDKLTNGLLYQMENYAVSAWTDGDYLAENFSPGPGFDYADVHSDTEATSSATAKSRWQAAFTRINSQNEVLKTANGAAEGGEAVERAKGTALFCRAWTYFQLVIRFGNVPVLNEPTMEIVPISPESKVWELIEADLLEAEKHLSAFTSYAYPSDEACWALLAKVYLWRGNKTEAINYADKVLANKAFQFKNTSNDYASLFINGTSNPELIFALSNLRNTSQLRIFEKMNDTDGSFNYSMETGLRSSLFADADVAGVSKSGDIRLQPTYNPAEDRRIIKFPNGGENMGQFISNPDASQSPIVLFRLSDIYLTKAEAQGNTSDGLATMKKYMENRYETVTLPTTMSAADFRELVLDENQREFYAEGRRWFDIKRAYIQDKTFDLDKVYKTWNDRDYLMYWPIPQDERDLAGHDKYPQNPGYAE